MVWLIEGYAVSRLARTSGWRRVALSQAVWERFVVVSEGARAQSEELRIWDLLAFLRGGLGSEPAAPRRDANCVDFLASVECDNPDCDHDTHDCGWPTTPVLLSARAGMDEDGSPSLIVSLPHEDFLR